MVGMYPNRREQLERLGESIALTEATSQEIQLELLRRTSFNMLSGERVARDLMAHRDLWQSVILDRMPIWSVNYAELSLGWLVKLRDLALNIWNADTLILLTDSEQKLHRLKEIADGWNGEVHLYDESKRAELDRCLGTGRDSSVLLTVWWD
ncbi:MAG: hypothetical protein KY476_10980 [Planctomycetes bacterium]|nr:hypothetical protein [Planctomycetota bacterium]